MARFRRKALVLLLAAMTLTAVIAVWDALRGEGAGDRLLKPVIKYHEAQYEINRAKWQSDLDRASEMVAHTDSAFDHLTRLSGDASDLTENLKVHRVNAWKDTSFAARGVVEDIKQVKERLRDAATHQSMTAYHLHLKFYYERLLKDRVTHLPQLPPALEAERKMIELDLRRRYGHLWEQDEGRMLLHQYESEPPPNLSPQSRP